MLLHWGRVQQDRHRRCSETGGNSSGDDNPGDQCPHLVLRDEINTINKQYECPKILSKSIKHVYLNISEGRLLFSQT